MPITVIANRRLGGPPPPPPPPSLGPVTSARASSVTQTSITLAWTNPTDASFTGVLIRRKQGATAPTSPTDGVLVVDLAGPGATYTDTGRTAATQYSYALFAHDAGPSYADPADVSATTSGGVGPVGPVTNARVAATTATSVALAWANPPQAAFSGVLIRRAVGATPPATPTSGTQVTNTGAAATSFTDTGLTTGTKYSYSLFAHDSTPAYAAGVPLTATAGAPILYGASPGGGGQTTVNNEIAKLGMAAPATSGPGNAIRSYTLGGPSFPTTWTDHQAHFVPSYLTVFMSIQPGADFGTNSAKWTTMASLLASFPANRYIGITLHHEADIASKGISAAQYDSMHRKLCDLVETENGNRGTNFIFVYTVMTGYGMTTNSGKRAVPFMDLLRSETRIKYFGFDCYTTNGATQSQAYCKTNSMPWMIPEAGAIIGEFPADPQLLIEMQALEDIWTGGSAAYPCKVVLWFDTNGSGINALDPVVYPTATAHYKALCASSQI